MMIPRCTRTQIVDDSDASFVTMTLDVFPGSHVVESGTGSGSMTLSLARAVGTNGHVFSYEYNASRATEAASEFEMYSLFSTPPLLILSSFH
jgi:tRNA (adenine57-N1/adenine58-N1)-methyltransferase catalytic subunit